MKKPRLINALPLQSIDEIKKCLIKKCNFALCINKIDEETMCQFQFACSFFLSKRVFYITVIIKKITIVVSKAGTLYYRRVNCRFVTNSDETLYDAWKMSSCIKSATQRDRVFEFATTLVR